MCLLRRLLFSVMVETISEDMAATRFSSEFHCDRQTLQLFRCDNGYPGNSLASVFNARLHNVWGKGKWQNHTNAPIYKLVTLKRRFESCQCEYCDSQIGILLKYEFLKTGNMRVSKMHVVQVENKTRTVLQKHDKMCTKTRERTAPLVILCL